MKELASRPEFPALYQLMPPPSEPFLWDTTQGARLARKSPYEADMATRLGLVPENVESARRFHAALDVERKPPNLDYFCFVGTRQPTFGNVQGELEAAAPSVKGVEISDAGDGTVPSWSASFPGMQQLAVGGEHGTLYQVLEVQRTIGALLGKDGVLAGLAEEYRISLSTQVAGPEQRLSAMLLSRVPHDFMEAEIVVTKLAAANGQPIAPAEVAARTVHYKGAPIDALSFVLMAPKYPGVYSYSLRSGGKTLTERAVELLVQAQ